MLNTFTLRNGIRVATYSLPQVRSIHLRISSKCGSIVESKLNNGVAHFMEHMLVQGIPSFPTSENLSAYVESLAGSFGAHTESLLIGFNITVPSTHLEDAIKISSEVFFEPLFVEESLEKEREVISSEIEQRMDSHFYKLTKFVLESRFKKDHPLTLIPGGTIDILKDLTKDDLINFWKQYFIPSNSYIFVIGNFDQKNLKEKLEKYFAKHPNHQNFNGFPKMSNDDFSNRQVFLRTDKSLTTCYLDLTFPTLRLEDDLRLRLKQRLALLILGQLRNSRLFKLLRYQRGLVYNVSVGSSAVPGLGYIYTYSEVSPKNLNEVINLIIKEFVVFCHHGPTKEELEFAKNFLTNQWLMAFDHPSSIASWVEEDLLWEKDILLPEGYADLIKDIKVEDLVEVMGKYWDFSKLNLTLQGPISNSSKNVKKYNNLIRDLR